MANTNKVLIPEAKKGLNQFKYEVAGEMGIKDYTSIDKGDLTSRQNGSIGGEMVKRMVSDYESKLK